MPQGSKTSFTGTVLAFDLGGSHVAAAVMGSGIGPIVSTPVAESGSAAETLSGMETTGRAALHAAGLAPGAVAAIAMAAPGPFDYDNGISQMRHKHAALFGHNFRESLSTWFGVERDRIVFLNDATAFLLGEVSRGDAETMDRMVGITLGTGIGSAFFAEGKVVVEGPGVPPLGSIYNLPWQDGTVEDRLSTRSLVSRYRDRSGRELSVKEIAERAASDAVARQVLTEFGSTLGQVLQGVLQEFDPRLIVLGGGITRSSHYFIEHASREFTSMQPRIQVCDRLDAAPLLGAAWWARSMAVAGRSIAG